MRPQFSFSPVFKGVPLPFHQPTDEDAGRFGFKHYFASNEGGGQGSRNAVPQAPGKLPELFGDTVTGC